MNDDLIKKGQQIVKELGGQDNDTLKEWMAHYIAELMEKTKSDNKEEAQEASNQCAQLIIRIWEMKVQQEVNRVEHELNSWRNRVYEESDEHYEKLRQALANPESLYHPLDAENGVTLRSLSEIEAWLMDLLWISGILNDPEKELLHESTLRIAESETKTRTTCQRVAKIFPNFATLNLTNIENTREQVTLALRSVDELRHVFLWEEND